MTDTQERKRNRLACRPGTSDRLQSIYTILMGYSDTFESFQDRSSAGIALMFTMRFCVVDKNAHQLTEQALKKHFKDSKVFRSQESLFMERISGNTTRLSLMTSIVNELYDDYDGDSNAVEPETAVERFNIKFAELTTQHAAIVAVKQRLTIERLQEELEIGGYTVRRNCISHELEARLMGNYISKSDFVPKLHSDLGERFSNVSMDVLDSYLSVIANKQEYNPVLDHLHSIVPDGDNHLHKLFALMGIQYDDLSMSLVHKWLLQSIALLHNSDDHSVGAEGILVLQGAQRVGKTSLLQKLALKSEWFGEGESINDHDKDTSRRVISFWITELGEVESTFKKSDVTEMKNFITRKYDQYRLPYARYDENHPRRTSLAATCNSDDYLVDDTGNRRYFTVPLDKPIAYDDIAAFDFPQLWAQIVEEYETIPVQAIKDKCFRLSPEEHEELAVRNGQRLKKAKAEQEILDIFTNAEEHPEKYILVEMTATDWKKGWSVLEKFDSREIGKVLKKYGKTGRHGMYGTIYKDLPIYKYN